METDREREKTKRKAKTGFRRTMETKCISQTNENENEYKSLIAHFAFRSSRSAALDADDERRMRRLACERSARWSKGGRTGIEADDLWNACALLRSQGDGDRAREIL